MVFSSGEYPLFLVAVFLLYLLLDAGGMRALLARLGLFVLLADLVYLLVSKDVGTLWDPLGALCFRAIVKNPPPLRSLVELGVGASVLALSVQAGLKFGRRLEADRAQEKLAALFAGILAGLGIALFVLTRTGTLGRLTAWFVRYGHLFYLAGFGLGMGAAVARESRGFARLVVLFVVSAVFYHSWAAGMPRAYKYLLLLILGTITLDYYLALFIARSTSGSQKRALLIVSLVSNLGVLALFKYFDFFLATLKTVFGLASIALPVEPFALILPAGISFHTFQSLSYTIDVYQGKIQPTRSILRFATFVLFFPQLVAGPIVRAHEFMPQLESPDFTVDTRRSAEGLFRILIGLFKKIALADFLAVSLSDRVFTDPQLFSGIEVLAGVYAYALQIYFDFSAYSDIAIGSAMLLGFDFPENFRTPYRSANLQEFWRRWHITLSSWLRDYLYIGLGGSRGPAWFVYRNLFITMLLGGLWHGASWAFIVWGALHGAGLAITRYFQRLESFDGTVFRRQARIALVAAGAFALVHAALAFGMRGGRESMTVSWLHLLFAWSYLTPAWAASCVFLSSPPRDRPQLVAVEPAKEEARRLAGLCRGLVVAGALPVGVALRFGLLEAWPLLLLSWFALACLADVAEVAPSAASTRAWLGLAWPRALSMVLTFNYVCLGWVFFRASTFENARLVLAQIGTLSFDATNLTTPVRLALVAGVLSHLFPPRTFRWLRDRFAELPAPGQALVLVVGALVLRYLARPTVVPFIYFQF